METDPRRWVAVLRASHERLRTLVASLSPTDLGVQSYATEWTVAPVLSHLGSQAEIFGMFLDAGLRGQQPPGQEAFPPVWDAWNKRTPQQQADDGIDVTDRFITRFEGLSDDTLATPIKLFGMDLLTGDVARLRVSENALHSWDIAVAFDPVASVAPDAVALLVDTVAALVARGGKPQGRDFDLHVHTTAPDRDFVLSVHATAELRMFTGDRTDGSLDLPAEALVRLVYGRLDAAHTPDVRLVADEITLDDLRRVFPGF